MSYLIKDEFKRAVVDGGMELLQQGLTVGTWGNLSVKDPETGLVYIKPSGMLGSAESLYQCSGPKCTGIRSCLHHATFSLFEQTFYSVK